VPTAPRILLYTNVDALGGAEIALGNLIGAASDKYDVHVACPYPPVLSWLTGRRAGVTGHPVGPGWPAHRRLLRRLRPDLVQVNLEVPWAAPTMLAVALAQPGLRVVAVEHMAARTTRLGLLLRTRALALRLDRHVAVSEDAARRVENFYALGRDSVQVIHNGVRPPALPPTVAPAFPPPFPPAPDVRPGRFVVGCVGRLDPVKGHDTAVRALPGLPDVQLAVVGSGPERAALHQLARELGVADRLRLYGWSDDVGTRLAGFDVFCHPSRYEGLGLALIEAMAAGLPCVASEVGGVPEVLGRCGVLVPPDDPAALALAVRRLRADPAERARLGARARRRALAVFSTERMGAAYEGMWEEVLAAPRAPRLRTGRPRA
jgi:glycosyltransferase involved in cell wall biosynthesis